MRDERPPHRASARTDAGNRVGPDPVGPTGPVALNNAAGPQPTVATRAGDQGPHDRMPYILVALILVQGICAAVFVGDVARDMADLGRGYFNDWHNGFEMAASVSLVIGIGLEGWFLVQILQRHARTLRGLGIASGALNELIEDYFRTWGLTPAEADVAAFTIKGLSITEVADLRGSREGTIKTHLNAIYRKAGVAGRGQLVSLLVEDLMGQPLIRGTGPVSPNGRGDSQPSGARR